VLFYDITHVFLFFFLIFFSFFSRKKKKNQKKERHKHTHSQRERYETQRKKAQLILFCFISFHSFNLRFFVGGNVNAMISLSMSSPLCDEMEVDTIELLSLESDKKEYSFSYGNGFDLL